ncbi:J domain-containing protein [Asticcacaulis machinosus]|uniref:DnaJ domain-containing protein n=1 Tax=Asticcacaulis machinosus TaxID=2984211 RepID=A0ABT5HNF4_9CAUL|nr:DnaJ domain-containing protein [Asticcacaulis machinosus]MDC7677681.1 DnaJ domain-containing protein [Asticcacaulis machinosus]
MIYILGALLGGFALLVWLGRKAKAGTLKPGPWIRQGGTINAILALMTLISGGMSVFRGQWIIGGALILLALAFLSGTRFRYEGDKSPQPARTDMTRAGAFKVLGLTEGADRKAILSAYRRLMKDAHPDLGGTKEKAAALNAARDILLKS